MPELKKITLSIPIEMYNRLVSESEYYNYSYVQELILAIIREHYFPKTLVLENKSKSKSRRGKFELKSIITKDVFK